MTDDELLTWPTFSANQYELAKNLKEKGYHVQHHGRSGFDTRNTYEISTVDGVISKEAVETINKDISDFYKQQEKAKLKQVDDMFEKNILDEEGIFSFVELGGEASNPWDYDRNKYTCVSSYRYMNYKIAAIYTVIFWQIRISLNKTAIKLLNFQHQSFLNCLKKRDTSWRNYLKNIIFP